MQYSNRYYLMRHGQSLANVEGKIVSHPNRGCQQYGLTEEGRQQVFASLATYSGPRFQQVLCSDFLRTKETALLVTEYLALPPPTLEPLLRERFFGQWEGLSDDNYLTVWQQDAAPPHVPDKGVETTEQVLGRALAVIESLESLYQNQTILLVSHGDLLQILRTAWSGVKDHEHRKLAHHKTAEILPLNSH